MKPSLSPSNDHVAVVFGGRSPIAIACALELARVQDVVLVTRRVDDDLTDAVREGSSRITLVAADLSTAGSGAEVVSSIYAAGRQLNAAVFLQRYRSGGETRFSDHAMVELWTIQDALEAIRQQKHADVVVQALISSSPAADRVVVDQDLAYHIVKAGQEALVRYSAARLVDSRVFVNGVRIGSIVMKERAASYWGSVPHVVQGLRQLAPSGALQTSEDVGASIAGLVLSGIGNATGQVISLDDGFSLRDGVQMAKASLENRRRP